MAGDSETVKTFKSRCADIAMEYFASGEAADAAARLAELRSGAQAPAEGGALFVKRLLTMAMDRGARAREAAARLLPLLIKEGGPLAVAEVEQGLELLLSNLENLTVDVPDAPELTLLFVLRGIVDGAATVAWLQGAAGRGSGGATPGGLSAALSSPPRLPRGTAGGEAARAALAALAAKEPAERAARAWLLPHGDAGSKGSISTQAAKAEIARILRDYLAERKPTETCRLLYDLQLPFYLHEAVKAACVLALEHGGEDAEALAFLCGRLAETGVASQQQLAAGLARLREALPDLCLDVPDAQARWETLRVALRTAGVDA